MLVVAFQQRSLFVNHKHYLREHLNDADRNQVEPLAHLLLHWAGTQEDVLRKEGFQLHLELRAQELLSLAQVRCTKQVQHVLLQLLHVTIFVYCRFDYSALSFKGLV